MQKYIPKRTIHSWGIVAGPGLSYFRGLSVESAYHRDRETKFGYTLGIELNHNLSKRLTLNGKLLLEKKGWSMLITGQYFDESTQSLKEGQSKDDYTYSYCTLPLLLEYGFGLQNFNIGLGLFTGYLSKQTLKQKFYFSGASSVHDQTKYNTKFDFGLCLSLRYQVPIDSKHSIHVQLLNTLGLINTRLHLTEGFIKSNNTSLLIGIARRDSGF